MSLTAAQYTTLANHIRANADPDVVAALAIRNDTEMARLYNLDSTSYIWRNRVEPSEYRGVIVWTEVDTLNAGNARIWEWLTSNMTESLDATDPNVRQGIADAFSGKTTLTALVELGKRIASVYESVFLTGAGTQGNPAVSDVEGPVNIQIISKALNDNPV